jgi:hypothetical protein
MSGFTMQEIGIFLENKSTRTEIFLLTYKIQAIKAGVPIKVKYVAAFYE